MLVFVGFSAENEFKSQAQSDCICPGSLINYQCSIAGGGTTVWRGTAIQCSGLNKHIPLRHSNFNASEKPYGECNNGAITARAIGAVDNRYISQLNVTVSRELINKTVECVYDGGTEEVVGSDVIPVTTGVYITCLLYTSPSPRDATLSRMPSSA